MSSSPAREPLGFRLWFYYKGCPWAMERTEWRSLSTFWGFVKSGEILYHQLFLRIRLKFLAELADLEQRIFMIAVGQPLRGNLVYAFDCVNELIHPISRFEQRRPRRILVPRKVSHDKILEMLIWNARNGVHDLARRKQFFDEFIHRCHLIQSASNISEALLSSARRRSPTDKTFLHPCGIPTHGFRK